MKVNDKRNYDKVRNSITMNNLGKLLKERNISVAKLATKSEIIITESVINQYINGSKLPSIPSIVSLANYLDCSIDFLLDRENNPSRASKINTITNDKDLNILINTITTLSKDKRKLLDAYVKGLIDNQ